MEASTTRTRFAPSPTGAMHLGNLRTALFNALLARRDGGLFLVRIEDTDRSRSEAGRVEGILADLRWLGLDWQEGPGCEAPEGGAFQSARGGIYADYFARLEADGRAYPCFCSEADLARARAAQRAAGRPPRYPGTCAALSREEAAARRAAGEPATLRFRVGGERELRVRDLVRGEQCFDTAEIGDFVIRRTDGTAAFFFCNAVDDALMGVTHVLRGEDHLTNTPRQCLVLEALGLPAPAYGHIGLIVAADGAPLSKRHGARSVAELRDEGYRPLALLNYLARLGHHYEDERLLDVDGLAAGFAPERLGRAPARFDAAQLDHWQGEAVAAEPAAVLAGWLPESSPVPAGQRTAFVEAVRANVRFPDDLVAWAERLFGEPRWDEGLRAELRDAGPDFFAEAAGVLAETGADWPAFTGRLKAATGRRGRALFMPLRVALTGAASGPELARVLGLLPTEHLRARLRAAAEAARGN